MKQVFWLSMAFYFILAMVSPVWAEGNDEHTVLLIHSDTFAGDVTFVDSSVGGTTHNLYTNGSVHHSADQAKFNGSSIYFDGVDDYLTVPNSSDWDFGNENFTIDFWLKTSATSNEHILSNYNGGAPFEGWGLIMGDGKIRFWSDSIGAWQYSNTAINDGLWHHIALVRVGSTATYYLDGNYNGSFTYTEYTPLNEDLFIGSYSNGSYTFSGFLDELRISKGIARWTTDFTPPPEPYSDDNCDATYDFFTNTLSVPCFEIDGKRYGFDMKLHGFDIIPDSVIEHP